MRMTIQGTPMYVLNDRRDLCYSISDFDVVTEPGMVYIIWNLRLVSGLDYVDIDNSNRQGWCPPENFIDDIQLETLIQYPMSEGLDAVLSEDGWRPVKMGDIERYLP